MTQGREDQVATLRARIAVLEAELAAARAGQDRDLALEAVRAVATGHRHELDALPDAVFVHDDERVVFVNQAAVRLFGARDKDELIGRPALCEVPPEDAAAQRARRRTVLEERRTLPAVEQQRRRLDGSPIWVESTSTFTMWEGKPAYLGVVRDITARKEAEAQHRQILDMLPDGVAVYIDEHVVFVNQAAVEILGAKSKSDLLGRPALSHVPPEFVDMQRARHRTVLEERCTLPLAVQKRRRLDGAEIWVETKATFTLWDGKPAFLGTIRDITGKRLVEQRAKQLHDWLLGAVESMPDGFMLWDADGRLVLWNERIARAYPGDSRLLVAGTGFDAVMESSFAMFRAVKGEAAARAWFAERHRLHREARGTFQFEGFDGRWFAMKERRTPDGFTVTIVSDITERKRDEDRVSESEARYRALIDLSPDAIYVHREGRIVLCNEAAVALYGATDADELIGRNTLALVHPEFRDLVRERQQLSFAQGTKTTFMRQRRLRLDGTAFWAEVAAAAIDWDGGRGGIVIVRDVTSQMRSEELLRRSKESAELANRAKTEFLANISHELRTPLNAIIGFSDVMQRELFGPLGNEQYAAYARDIHQSGTHLHEVINDILDLSKIEAGKLDLREEPVDIEITVLRCVRLLRPRAEAGNIRLETRLAQGLPPLMGDDRKIKQVLINLLSNAVKFTEAGGTVAIEAALAEDGGLALAVVDTGIGMAPEDIPVALQPFGQLDSALNRKYEGTGLGLPLSKSLIEMHGGSFTIESAPGKGTRVTVRFPPERVAVATAAE